MPPLPPSLQVFKPPSLPGTRQRHLTGEIPSATPKVEDGQAVHIAAQGDMLRAAADDRTLNVFDPAIRGQTDRFVLRLRK